MASKSSQIVTEERYANLLAYFESNSMGSAVLHSLFAEGKTLCENDDKYRRRHKVHWLQYGDTVALYAPKSFYKTTEPEQVREYNCRLQSFVQLQPSQVRMIVPPSKLLDVIQSSHITGTHHRGLKGTHNHVRLLERRL